MGSSDFVIENGVLEKYTGNDSVVKIPVGVTIIGDRAFSFCNSILSVRIPNSVTTIGNRAFGYCKKLKSVKIPKSVTSIGYGAF